MIKLDAKELKELVSPEGLTEKIIKEFSVQVTQTQGGKFRIYFNDKPTPMVKDTKEEAFEEFKRLLSMMRSFEIDPRGTFNTVINILKGRMK